MRSSVRVLCMVACLTWCGLDRAPAQEPVGPAAAVDFSAVEANIRAGLVNRIDEARNSVGIVVGILSSDGQRYLAHGSTAKENGVEPGHDTLFEIGSITKVFTGLLLADMVERGEMNLDDPISRYLPDGLTLPSRNGKEINLAHLATHTSGLPRIPGNIDAANTDLYAAYGEEDLYAFLSEYALTREPGEQWEYSNVGGGLLGHILSLHAGVGYEELVRTRILEPLAMHDTTITLSAAARGRTATGHDMLMNPARLWSFDVLAGAAAMRSTASDMLTFAAAVLGLVEHPLEAAMQRMLSVSLPAAAPGLKQHLGWFELGRTVLFHEGGTAGFRAALAVHPEAERAAIALSNSFQDVTELALHAVAPQQPLAIFEPPRERSPIAVAAAVLERYVGVYEIAPHLSIEITRAGKRLFARATDEPRSALLAEGEAEFYDAKNPLIAFQFLKDGEGRVASLVLSIGGTKLKGRRLP
jgi:serine-type D-Ala-D-Ala carboxypeptidase/endopeptidase